MKENVVVIGSGMAGCFIALLLAKKGYKVDIYGIRRAEK
jgi:2-polyprenyl-6-methoxyphenol hydroxylase-like FAD-dependent oxidoreductase